MGTPTTLWLRRSFASCLGARISSSARAKHVIQWVATCSRVHAAKVEAQFTQLEAGSFNYKEEGLKLGIAKSELAHIDPQHVLALSIVASMW